MIRWAILGTGKVTHKFVSDMRHASVKMTAVSVASRNFRNAVAFRDEFNSAQACETYEDAILVTGVDAVYIATPPSEHEKHALMALSAGKAVLIEKPFAEDAQSARRIADAAEQSGLFCMEGMWTRFLPLMDVVRRRLKNHDIGELRTLDGSFGISSHPDAKDSLFDPQRGGGALLHRGIYPLSLAHHLIGPVSDINVTGRLGETGVDEECRLILTHESGVISTVSASLRAPMPNDLTIGGTQGAIRLAKPVYRPFVLEVSRTSPRTSNTKTGRLGRLRESDMGQMINQHLPSSLRDRLEKTSRQRIPYKGHGYHYEADEVAHCMMTGQKTSLIMPMQESISIMELVDIAYSKLRRGF
jgi:predicted dehydrogenase